MEMAQRVGKVDVDRRELFLPQPELTLHAAATLRVFSSASRPAFPNCSLSRSQSLRRKLPHLLGALLYVQLGAAAHPVGIALVSAR